MYEEVCVVYVCIWWYVLMCAVCVVGVCVCVCGVCMNVVSVCGVVCVCVMCECV